MAKLKVLFCVFLYLSSVQCYRFLLGFTVVSPSLSYIGGAYAQSLVDAGHEVVFVTPHPLKDPPKIRFRQIDVSSIIPTVTANLVFNISELIGASDLQKNDVIALQKYGLQSSLLGIQHKDVMELLNDDSQKFDAVIADLFESKLWSGVAVAYNCPMMWSYSIGMDSGCLKLIDSIANPAFVPNYLSSNVPPFSFWQRVEEVYNELESSFVERYYLRPEETKVYKEIIGPIVARQGRTIQDFEDAVYNTSFIFGNVHLATRNLPALPRNFASIGGIWIKEPAKPLPKNLQKICDAAHHGVIYFSLGTNWKSSTMPPSLIRELLETFGKLKQTVIWKFEEDLPDTPSNVHTVEYAPQQSILAHPNMFLFITHGGLLSATEAVHFGIPLITIPVYFDQYRNADKAVVGGYGLRVDLSFDMAKHLGVAIHTIVGDERFKQKAKEVSSLYHARPLHPSKVFVHWVEHVVKTKGAAHLRSPALHVAWYQKIYLDVVFVFLAIFILFIYVLYKVVKVITKGNVNVNKKRN